LVLAIGAAAFSSLNERGLNHSRRQTQAQLDLSSELEHAGRPDQICAYLASHVRTRMGFQRAVVLVTSRDRCVGAVEDHAGTVLVDAPAVTAASPGVAGECMKSHDAALVQTLDPDTDALLDALLPYGRNMVVLALLADGEPVGLLAAEWAGGRWSRMPTSTLTALIQSAAHTAMSLRTIMLMAEVERLARHDRLTGLSNRHEFDEVLPKEFSRSQRSNTPLGLVLVDIDHFKDVNDTHGHQVGDDVLREVGGILGGLIRHEDVAARFGGEEFVVLLPGIDADGAVATAERLRGAVSTGVRAVPVTMSAGVACYPDHAASIEELIGQADAALYQAKRSGRDRTVLCPQRLTTVLSTA
jgi:diguanylate cyclase (GGDEF)-like protein